MLEFLDKIDTQLFLFLNSLHSSFFDVIMHYLSAKTPWIPLYVIVAFFILKKYKFKRGVIVLLFFGLLIFLTDQSSVRLFKNVFERLRPCHNPDIQHLVHTLNHCGGQFGFVSSHAANSFAFAVLSLLVLKTRSYTISILIWAFLVSYSRVYLGVHYPGDIICGGLLGALIAFLVYKLYEFTFINKF